MIKTVFSLIVLMAVLQFYFNIDVIAYTQHGLATARAKAPGVIQDIQESWPFSR
jgi:Tfp pilus assembly protein PilW